MYRYLIITALLIYCIMIASCNDNTSTILPSSHASYYSSSIKESVASSESIGSQSKTSDDISAIEYHKLISKNLQYGTTPGNIMNNGVCAVSDDWVYFSNSNAGDSLFKIRLDGTGLNQLTIDKANYLNIYDGYLYFIYSVFMEESYLAKVSISSGEENFLNNDNAADFLSIHNNSIYYISDIKNEGYLKRYIDSNSSEIIVKKNIRSYQFTENRLIYLTSDPDNQLYSANKDGTDEILVVSNDVSFFTYDSGWIYYTDSVEHQLHRTSIDGTTELIIDDSIVGRFNISNGWIYYVNESDNGSLNKMRIDGNEKIKLVENDCFSINIFGEILVYQADSGSSFVDLRWVYIDGTGNGTFLLE